MSLSVASLAQILHGLLHKNFSNSYLFVAYLLTRLQQFMYISVTYLQTYMTIFATYLRKFPINLCTFFHITNSEIPSIRWRDS